MRPKVTFLYRFKRWFKFWWQRRTRGWDDSETWSLDCSLAELIAPRLKRFKEVNNCHPSSMTSEEWDAILDRLIFTFEWIAAGKKFEINNEQNEAEYVKVEEGLALFSKYYFDLWW